jgi:uncharacterized protein YggE
MQTLSVHVSYTLAVKPDCALIKFHFTGEGMTLEDSVASVHKKVHEVIEYLKSNHASIRTIQVFDIYFGQKEDRLRSEPQSFPRPLVVQGVLVETSPTDSVAQYRIVDDGIKRGAILDSPHNRSYLNSDFNSSILYGLIDSEEHEVAAIKGCLKQSASRAAAIAGSAGKRFGKLVSVDEAKVESSASEVFHRDSTHISKSFPTRFLSPTPQHVVLIAKLKATYELLDD